MKTVRQLASSAVWDGYSDAVTRGNIGTLTAITDAVAKAFGGDTHLIISRADWDVLKQFRTSGQPGDGVCGESLIWFPEHEIQSIDEIIDRIEKELPS